MMQDLLSLHWNAMGSLEEVALSVGQFKFNIDFC